MPWSTGKGWTASSGLAVLFRTLSRATDLGCRRSFAQLSQLNKLKANPDARASALSWFSEYIVILIAT